MSTTTATQPALELAGLTAGYGRFDVVHGVDLTVAPGEAVGLVGPNGAGKTTILNAIMGMVRNRAGAIRVAGTDVITLPTHQVARGHAAIVPEGRRLFAELTVEDNLRLGGLRLRDEPDRVESLLAGVFALFPVLEEHRARPSTALSGGEQQMVAIGRMLMSDPAILLLDEPSLGLAPKAIDRVGEALMALREQGRSLLLVEQRVDLVLRVCDRFYVMTEGRIALQDRTDNVNRDERALIDAYLG